MGKHERGQPGGADGPERLAVLCGHLARHAPFAMACFEGPTHVLRFANPAFGQLCARPVETLLGRPVREALPEWAANGGLASLLDRVAAGGKAVNGVALQPSGPPGGIAPWSVTVWPLAGAGRTPMGLMVQVAGPTETLDREHAAARSSAGIREVNEALVISSVKQHELAETAVRSEAVLRESQQLERNAAVLEERTRIARDIHDTLAQAFTGILMQLRVAQRIAPQRPEEAWSIISHVGDLAQQGLAEARRSMWALQPDAWQHGDLVAALTGSINRLASSSSTSVELHVEGPPRPVPPDVGVDLVRIGQEALTNALRHAQAQMVRMELTFAPDRVLLRVQDDGRGFDVAGLDEAAGFGLVAMGQRAERLGGTLTIASQRGRGTEVAASVPLPPADMADDPPAR